MYVHVLSCFSRVQLFVTPWTVAHQAPLSMRLSRQESWSGLPFPSLGDLPDPGIECMSLASPALAVRFFTNCTTWEALFYIWNISVYMCVCVCVSNLCMRRFSPGIWNRHPSLEFMHHVRTSCRYATRNPTAPVCSPSQNPLSYSQHLRSAVFPSPGSRQKIHSPPFSDDRAYLLIEWSRP